MEKSNLLEGKPIVTEPKEKEAELVSPEQVEVPVEAKMQEQVVETPTPPQPQKKPTYHKKSLWPFFVVMGVVIIVGAIIYYLMVGRKPAEISPDMPAFGEVTDEDPAFEATEIEPPTVAAALQSQRAYSVTGSRLLTQIFGALSETDMALSFFTYNKGVVSVELLAASDDFLSAFNLNLKEKNPQLQFRVLAQSDFQLADRTVRKILLTGTFSAGGMGVTTGDVLKIDQLDSEIEDLAEKQDLLLKELSISPAVAVANGHLVPLSLKVYGRSDKVFHFVETMLDDYRNIGFSRMVVAVRPLQELGDEYITAVFDIDLFTVDSGGG